MLTFDLSPDVAIREELGQREKLLWAGRPRQGIVLRRGDWLMIPFSLIWGGFALVWEVMGIIKGAPWFFVAFGVPFVLLALHLIFGRFLLDARQRAETSYAITSDRVVIVHGVHTRQIKSLDLGTLSDITLTERPDGSGSITLGPRPVSNGFTSGPYWPGMSPGDAPSLELADEARRVYDILCMAQREVRHGL